MLLKGVYAEMKNHEIDYVLHGDDMQFVEVELDPQETVVAEAVVCDDTFIRFSDCADN